MSPGYFGASMGSGRQWSRPPAERLIKPFKIVPKLILRSNCGSLRQIYYKPKKGLGKIPSL
jgi:hypothetical protein